jgi:ESCRT-I complex subunit TSG101
MVQDPRVTTLLSRLGGLYRDPARVDRDASSLLKSSVGVHLTPGIAPLVENNGDSSHCLVLQGTIAIVFRGQTYQLLVDIYLPPGYPIRPPGKIYESGSMNE